VVPPAGGHRSGNRKIVRPARLTSRPGMASSRVRMVRVAVNSSPELMSPMVAVRILCTWSNGVQQEVIEASIVKSISGVELSGWVAVAVMVASPVLKPTVSVSKLTVASPSNS
jgi:hypothetical protein